MAKSFQQFSNDRVGYHVIQQESFFYQALCWFEKRFFQNDIFNIVFLFK